MSMWRQEAAAPGLLMSHVMQISAAPDAGQLPPLVLPAPAVPGVSAAPAFTVTLQVTT